MQKDNATVVLTGFVKELKAPITRNSISDELQKHPDSYSMLGFSDVLNNFGVTGGVYQVPFSQLSEVPTPFIGHLRDKSFVLVKKFTDNEIVVSNEKWTDKTTSPALFKDAYAGTLLIAEDVSAAGEYEYDQKRKTQFYQDIRVPLGIIGLTTALIVLLAINGSFRGSVNLPVVLLVLIKTIGLGACVLLLVQSVDANNPFVQKLCGGDNDKNCNAILSSKAAKLGGISWSEAGFFYFAGTWLTLLFNNGHTAIIQILALLNIVSLPYTFYSIYYQWRVAKQWCVFCCTVQIVFWLEFLCFFPYLTHLKLPQTNEWLSLCMTMLLPASAWTIAKPYFLYLASIAPLKNQLRLFKYSKELFDSALKAQPKYAVPDDEWSIVLGNVEASNVFVIVSNPYCQPCAKAHAEVEDALHNNDDIQVRIVFVGRNSGDNPRSMVHKHLMALNALPDKTIVRKALHDWYGQKQKSYDEWALKYPITFGTENNDKLEKQSDWIEMTGITATPTLLLNGYQLPRTYQLKELKYMLYEA